MVSAFIQEEKKYTKAQIKDILRENSDSKLNSILKKLKEYGILKIVKEDKSKKDITELLDENLEITEFETIDREYRYVFTYVGIIIVEDKVLKCYPKYISSNEEPIKELKQVLKVLQKYSNSKKQELRMFNDNIKKEKNNLLALQMFLINDYYENGIYTNSNSIVEKNGGGEIIWDRTISENVVVIQNNKPYYLELQTRRNIENESDFIKRVHEIVLTKITSKMKEEKLLELLEVTEIELSNENLTDLGDIEYILYRIENELNTQFNSRKQSVLKALYSYIKENGHLNEIDYFTMYGTNSFNLVWQEVCECILDNKLEKKISEIKLPIKNNQQTRLIDIIEKPYWSISKKEASRTLEPDIISIYEQNDKYCFAIFDAKYYNPVLNKGQIPTNIPGVDSVTKQYLYQLAYNNFMIKHRIKRIYNCFLIPTEDEEIQDLGYVSLKILDDMKLQNIQVIKIPAKIAFDLYLKGKKYETIKQKVLKDCHRVLLNNDEKMDDDSKTFYKELIAEEQEQYTYEDYDIFKQNKDKFKTSLKRSIYYYGEEYGKTCVINKCFENIHTLDDLFGVLLRVWNDETIYAIEKIYNKDDNPTFGQSAVTVFVVNLLFGGEIYKIKIGEKGEHLFNIVNNHIIDLTKDQFDISDIKFQYETKEKIDINYLIYNRELIEKYKILMKKIENYINE